MINKNNLKKTNIKLIPQKHPQILKINKKRIINDSKRIIKIM